jgi:hypothetical protein
MTAIRTDAIAANPWIFYRFGAYEADSFLLKRGETSRPGHQVNMVRSNQPGKGRRAGRQYAVLAMACCSFALLNGCAATNQAQHDPLLGDPKGVAPAVPAAPPSKTSSIAPPPMTPTSGTNAALAANTLPNGKPLAIKEATWQRHGPAPAKQPSQTPVPVVQHVPREGQPSNNVQTTGWTPADSPEAFLQSRNILNPQQEKIPEGVRVSGFVRDRTTPTRLHFIEATAVDYATAVRALAQQVDQLR